MSQEDQIFLNQAKTGDKVAFGKLVEKYYEMVYAVIFGILGNREESLDLAQDLFVKVYRELNRFRGDSSFKTWLYRIAVNMAIDLIRKRRPFVPIDEGMELPVEKPSPRDQASQEELSRFVREALALLSPEHRAILVLREWHDLSYEEIAETLRIDLGTVMSRLHYARKKLGEVVLSRFGRIES